MKSFRRLLATDAPAAVILIRLIVGGVFLSEGIQKFLFPDALGVGRFAKIGIPAPEVMAPFVGVCEIVCGALLLIGLLTRFAAITMIIDMLVAISTTKVPILLNEGFWKMAHEARTDWSMLLGSLFLLVVGAGAWSVDALLARLCLPIEKCSAVPTKKCSAQVTVYAGAATLTTT
ncbi:MAG TPA: DoxX family protein [Gemmataceae bacterium]|nr:DoxX family protein [Gemmataceae bacterium]